MEHHTLLHAEKSYNCNYCDMSFLKRAEREHHVRRAHQHEVVQKNGIIDRKAAAGKSQYSPYVKKGRDFKGYKTKELIQKRNPDTDNDDTESIWTQRMHTSSPTSSKWSAYSMSSSSCYSTLKNHANGLMRSDVEDGDDNEIDETDADETELPSEPVPVTTDQAESIETMETTRAVETVDEIETDDAMEPIENIENIETSEAIETVEVSATDEPNDSDEPLVDEALDSYDIFSIDFPETDSLKRSEIDDYDDDDYNASDGQQNDDDDGVHDEFNNEQIDNEISKKLMQRKNINRNIILFSCENIEKFLPPYDEIFEKYLNRTDNRFIAIENIIDEDSDDCLMEIN